uniref:G-protein coupled receptors family 1 profile domain-containing protein n=1 Tax=Ditylenchus dipsaci TaxID=166011 RepID=A0A915EJ55_9BILA
MQRQEQQADGRAHKKSAGRGSNRGRNAQGELVGAAAQNAQGNLQGAAATAHQHKMERKQQAGQHQDQSQESAYNQEKKPEKNLSGAAAASKKGNLQGQRHKSISRKSSSSKEISQKKIIYIPCLLVIYKNMAQSCYKIMFVIGVSDIIGLVVIGLLSGYFSVAGSVYCSYPTLIFFSGFVITICWGIETTCAVLLALNRCIGLWKPSLFTALFKGFRTWVWLAVVLVYVLWYALLFKPAVFSSLSVSWVYNPHSGYYNELEANYTNNMEARHECFVFSGLCSLYIAFVWLLSKKHTKAAVKRVDVNSLQEVTSGSKNVSQKMIVVQVLFISAANLGTITLYLCTLIFTLSNNFYILMTLIWCLAHGFPPVIYLMLNRTIRMECVKMLKGRFRLWMLIGLVSGVLLVMVVIVCCFMRIRIPRTKRQIELIAAKRKMRKQQASNPNPGVPGAYQDNEVEHRSQAIVMNSLSRPIQGQEWSRKRMSSHLH